MRINDRSLENNEIYQTRIQNNIIELPPFNVKLYTVNTLFCSIIYIFNRKLNKGTCDLRDKGLSF